MQLNNFLSISSVVHLIYTSYTRTRLELNVFPFKGTHMTLIDALGKLYASRSTPHYILPILTSCPQGAVCQPGEPMFQCLARNVVALGCSPL